jgi:dihydrodipicolinate synthase/N-acetylneuraminate lyase
LDTRVFAGTIPALMTPCTADRRPDFDGLVRKARELVNLGMSGVVYCGSMGDWPLLTTEERMQGVTRLVEEGIPVVVGTGAINTKASVALAAHAQATGAKGLMIIPRLLSRGTVVSAQRNHFSAVLSAAPSLPAVIYNSPYYGFATRADLFFDLRARHANLVGFKEFGGDSDLSYAAEYIVGEDSSLSLLVGVDTAVYHGIVNCGATGAITGIGNVLPEPVLRLVALCKSAARGDVDARRYAYELDQALHVLSKVDAGPDLVLYFKHMMVVRGEREYERNFDAADRLSKSQAHHIEKQLRLFESWYQQWNVRPEVIAATTRANAQ